MATKKAAPAAPVDQPSSLFYEVTDDRIGHPKGTILEYDHEPHPLFLRCLKKVEEAEAQA